MTNTDFIGYMVVFCIPLVASFVALIKPIIALNVNIQKLADSIKNLYFDRDEIKNQVNGHEVKINDHETRITLMEKRDK